MSNYSGGTALFLGNPHRWDGYVAHAVMRDLPNIDADTLSRDEIVRNLLWLANIDDYDEAVYPLLDSYIRWLAKSELPNDQSDLLAAFSVIAACEATVGNISQIYYSFGTIYILSEDSPDAKG